MFQDTEEELLAERNTIKAIPVLQRTEGQLQRLNFLEAELLRRNPEQHTAPQADDASRARSVLEEVNDNIAKIRMRVKIASANVEIDKFRTSILIGKGVVRDGESHAIWITARHGGGTETPILTGVNCTIELRSGHSLFADCIYDDKKSDISILVSNWSDSLPIARLPFSTNIAVGTEIFILGYGNTTTVDKGLSTLTKGIIANEVAAHYDVMPPQSAEELEWRASRFFLVNMTVDYGVSGGPVFDKYGYLKGMVCESHEIGISWALKANFMLDALQEVVVSWV